MNLDTLDELTTGCGSRNDQYLVMDEIPMTYPSNSMTLTSPESEPEITMTYLSNFFDTDVTGPE